MYEQNLTRNRFLSSINAQRGETMNHYPFNQCCYLYFARGLMAFGVILITSKVAMADVISLSVTKEAQLVDNNTTAIVTGEVACSDGETYNVSAVVGQNLTIGTGTLVPVIDFGDYPACSGSPIPFEVQVRAASSGTFVPGEAEATVSALATGTPAGSDTQRVDTTLELSD
jgi:hypothetical protein